MIRNHNDEADIQRLTGDTGSDTAKPFIAPKPVYLNGVNDIAGRVSGQVEADFNDAGEVRSLYADGPHGLFAETFSGNAVNYATKFINSPDTKKALGLRYATLVAGETVEFEYFTRVEFKQVANVRGMASAIPVRGGFVHVFIDKSGNIIQVNSTVRRGIKPNSLGRIITQEKAIELAKAKFGVEHCDVPKCTLVLSSHDGSMDPVYEVLLSSCEPRKLALFLVKAKTSEVVYVENKLHFSQTAKPRPTKPRASKGIIALSFPRIPDYRENEPITKQVGKVTIDPAELPDPKLLKNPRYDMKVKDATGKWVTVAANAKGTFEFDPLSKDKVEVAKFTATVEFHWLNTQDVTFESQGAVKVPNPIPVFIHMDSDAGTDNAYFDPSAWEIHLLPGTGLKAGGLVENIGWDTGVGMHENVHKRNAAEAPGKDLPGRQGMAAGEATADIYGDIMSDLQMRLANGAVLGHTLTLQDIIDEPGIIGKYCLPPDGIRIQQNKKQYPGDIKNEEHDDGLIIGGAFLDLLKATAAVPGAKVEDVLTVNAKLYLNGTRLLPAHKVLFTDYVRAFTTADKSITGGANKDLIVKAFAGHGIKLSTGSTSPSKRKPGKGKGKGKTTPRRPRKAA